jgi:hypothetical protein
LGASIDARKAKAWGDKWSEPLSFIRTLGNVQMNAAQTSPRSLQQSKAENAFRQSSVERGSVGISPSMGCGVANDTIQNKLKLLLSKKVAIGWFYRSGKIFLKGIAR